MDINTVLIGMFGIALLSVGGALLLAGVLAHKALGIVRIDSSVRIDNATTGDVNTGDGQVARYAEVDLLERTSGWLNNALIALESVDAWHDDRYTGDPVKALRRAQAYISVTRLALRKGRARVWSRELLNADIWDEWEKSAHERFSAN